MLTPSPLASHLASHPASPVAPGRAVRRPRALAGLLAAGLLLTGCSGGGGSEEPSEESSATPTESATKSSSPTEPGDDVTSPGTILSFGEKATVEYETDGRTATLDLNVKSAEQGALDDFSGFDTQDPQVRDANFYYVRVTVKNAGEKPFGGAEVPLWGISGANTLLPPVKFTSAFDTCPTKALPPKFKPGDTLSTCLVFLSPDKGELEGVSYRPVVDVTPIEWRGKVKTDAPKKKSGDTKAGGKKKQGSGRG